MLATPRRIATVLNHNRRTSSSISGIYVTTIFLIACMVAACSSPQTLFARRAAAAGITATPVQGTNFTHLIYQRAHDTQPSAADFVLVFIEGDSAWVNDKPVYVYDDDTRNAGIAYTKRPVKDPTPRHPLALNLMLKTSQPAWYITRPCYNGLRDAACSERVWTDARYSSQVVESMATAITRYANTQHVQRLALVGYSGGGTLAVLLAARLPQAIGVISIAANLDTQVWATTMHFDPLLDSLNPAVDVSTLSIPHITLVGDEDAEVPFSTLAQFLVAQPQTVVTHYAGYDHVCCWEENWPVILAAALAQFSVVDVHPE
jgi:hypothetical protein